jgi:hypothetical protein
VSVPAVLICGFGGHLIVAGMSTGLFLPSAITLDIAKDIAKAFSGLALTFGSCAGITFNTCKYFAKADKTERAMLQKDREKIYQEKKRLHVKQQEMYRKEIEKCAQANSYQEREAEWTSRPTR